MFKTILVCSDGSDPALNAARTAAHLACKFEAQVILLNVFDDSVSTLPYLGVWELGIRPEDFYETSPRPGDERLVPVAMRVLAVEPLGAETLLVLALDGSREEIIARIGRETRLRPDDRATLLLDATAIQLFDAATTRVIARDRV